MIDEWNPTCHEIWLKTVPILKKDLVHQLYESDVSCLSLVLIRDNRFEILGLLRLLWFLLVIVQPEFSLRWSFGLQESPQCLPWRPGLEICEVSHKVSKGYLIIVVPENDGFWKSVAVFVFQFAWFFEVSCFTIRAFFFWGVGHNDPQNRGQL